MDRILIDLFSDTMTMPTPGMRKFMSEAEVGDEQQKEDPSVNRLVEMVCDLLGKEDAMYLPSGTMCNQIAFRVYCRPGDEIIMDTTAHTRHLTITHKLKRFYRRVSFLKTSIFASTSCSINFLSRA